MPSTVLQAGAIVLFLGGLIFVHELGHFLVAKAFGVKVLRFSIGFGPRFLGFTRGETEYWLAVFPLGGYVKMAGDLSDDPEKALPEDRGRGYLDQTPWRRLAISAAGPAMNLIFPFIVFFFLAVAENGHPVPGPFLGAVVPGSPAAAGGLRAGDRVLTMGQAGRPPRTVRRFSDLRDIVAPHPGEPIVLTVQRDGRELPPITITPGAYLDRSVPVETVRKGLLGVAALYAPALVAPVRPGAAGPLEPFDLVVAAAGAPIKTYPQLERAVAAAGCAPLDLDVVREEPVSLPGVTLSTLRPVHLAGVPSCVDGKPAFLAADATLSTFVGSVDPASPAARAGLRRGDEITSMNGKRVLSFTEIAAVAQEAIGGREPTGDPAKDRKAPLLSVGLGDGRTISFAAGTQRYTRETSREERWRYVVGFEPEHSRAADPAGLVVQEVPMERGLVELTTTAWDRTAYVVRIIFKGIVKLVTRELPTDMLAGPGGIFRMAAEAAEEGISSFLFQMAVISVNLALMNLLPIPVLDGGNIAQALLEGITRRPLSARTRMVAQAVGLAVLLMLMLLVFKNDITRSMMGN